MAKLDRYILIQLLGVFGFFSLIVVLIYWVNRAVILFDRLIADGQSAALVFQLIALSLPAIVLVVLPISAFCAAIYVTNRLLNDSELVVVQATGYSAKRLARPFLIFGFGVSVFLGLLSHVVVPNAAGQTADMQRQIQENVTAGLLSEGTFLHPTRDVTFYLRDITAEGELRDVFLSDRSNPRREITYTAKRAFLLPTEDGPQFVMIEGMIQIRDRATQRIDITKFNDFVIQIGTLIGAKTNSRLSLEAQNTVDLLTLNPRLMQAAQASVADMIVTGHTRIFRPLLAIVTVLIGFSVLIATPFSRFGVWRSVMISVGLFIFIKGIEGWAIDVARDAPGQWFILYSPIFVGVLISFGILLWADRPWASARWVTQ